MEKQNTRIKPSDCKSLEELRSQIDDIDRIIISLWAERFSYVKEVTKYKKHDKDSIIAQERYDAVIKKRKEWASELGLDPEKIEQIYRIMMNYFIEEELKIVNKK